ncbi:MAG: dTMP kinase [Candidatus Levybacteria bacterium]|nr:dTMP kinase [Candidatus Levybacteria bacterium]
MNYHVEFDIDLKRNPYKGRYIALEGIDGSGKTTQAEKLAQYFESKGKKVVLTSEPRKEGVIGDIVQQVLTGKLRMPPVGLQYLFSTDRVLHHAQIIEPALKEGKVVVSDRCFWSAVVYGILDRVGEYSKETANFLLISQSILSMYHQFIVPDYTFLLKVSLDSAISRISQKDDVKEIYEDKEKLRKVNEGYDWLAREFADEIKVVDGEGEIDEVTRRLISEINK